MSVLAYIKHVYLNYLGGMAFDDQVGAGWIPKEAMDRVLEEALSDAFAEYGFKPTGNYDDIVNEVTDGLIRVGALISEGDDFTGFYQKMLVGDKDAFVRVFCSQSEVGSRIKRLGSEALQRAIENVAQREGWISIDEKPIVDADIFDKSQDGGMDIEIPASNRVVTLSHNQQDQLLETASEVIQNLASENAIDGDVELRGRLLGEVRAGRELIQAQTFRAYLLYQTLMSTLGTLIERYKGAAIGEAAKKLLGLLIEHVFGK